MPTTFLSVPYGDSYGMAVNLGPIGVCLRPEHCAPRLIQRVQGLVSFPAPKAESFMIACGETNVHVAVEFVVDLPADYCLVLFVVLGQLGYDLSAFLNVYG